MGFLSNTPEDDENLANAGSGPGEGTNQLPAPGGVVGLASAVPEGLADAGVRAYDLAAQGIKSAITDASEGLQNVEQVAPFLGHLVGIGAHDPGEAQQSITELQSMTPAVAPELPAFKEAEKYRDAVAAYAAQGDDPMLTGSIARGVKSITAGAATVTLGTAITGGDPIGGALLLGGTAANDRYNELRAQGVDENTAQQIAGIAFLTNAPFAYVPLKFEGSIPAALAKAVGVGVGLDVAGRGAQAAALDANGYPLLAQQQHVIDKQSMLADAVLSVMFAGLGRFLPGAREGEGRMLPTPSQADGASSIAADRHFTDSGIGIATNPGAANAHVDAMRDTIDAMLHDRPVPPVDDAAARQVADGMILNPENLATAAAHAQTINESPAMEGLREAPDVPEAPANETTFDATQPAPVVTGDAMQDGLLASLVAQHGDKPITDDNGNPTTVAAYADALRANMAAAEQNANLVDAAIGCFIQTGAVA